MLNFLIFQISLWHRTDVKEMLPVRQSLSFCLATLSFKLALWSTCVGRTNLTHPITHSYHVNTLFEPIILCCHFEFSTAIPYFFGCSRELNFCELFISLVELFGFKDWTLVSKNDKLIWQASSASLSFMNLGSLDFHLKNCVHLRA